MEFEHYLAERHLALLRFATVLTGDLPLAEDIVADVLGRAYERWDRIAAMSEPNAYVRRMIVNDYLSWRRRLQRTQPRADLEPYARPESDRTNEHAARDEMRGRLAKLPRRQRAAVVLRYYEGLPDDEVATLLGCGRSAVRSNISRGLAALRIDIAADQESALTTIMQEF